MRTWCPKPVSPSLSSTPRLLCSAQSKLDEAVKEAALARTLAEGWQRDVREAEKRTAAEAAKGAALHKELQVGQGAGCAEGAGDEAGSAELLTLGYFWGHVRSLGRGLLRGCTSWAHRRRVERNLPARG